MAVKSIFSKKLFAHPIFWIGLFFLIRLVGLFNPPLETGHNWRQVTGLMVSRNFLEVEANPFYPRVDDNNGESGIIGMEFPLMNYLVFLIAKIFGYQHWYGRLVGLIISSFGMLAFYDLIKRWFNSKMALSALILLLSSIWFNYSRKMMPDVFCISLILIAINAGDKYLLSGKMQQLFLFLVLICFAVLSKIPAIVYFPVILLIIAYRPKHKLRMAGLIAGILTSSVFVYLWYFVWCPHLASTYGNWFNAGQSFTTGWQEISNNLSAVFKNFYFHSFYSYTAFIISIAGLIIAIIKKKRKILLPVFSVAFLFFLYIIKSGFYFHHHNYYIIPFVPILALLASYALQRIKQQYLFIGLILIASLESIANQQHDFFIKDSEKYKMRLEHLVDQHIPKESLVAINSPDNPQEIYLSHRKGWICTNQQLKSNAFIEELKKSGCAYLIINKKKEHEKISIGKILYEGEFYRISQFE